MTCSCLLHVLASNLNGIINDVYQTLVVLVNSGQWIFHTDHCDTILHNGDSRDIVRVAVALQISEFPVYDE